MCKARRETAQTGQLTRILKGEIKVNPLAFLNRTRADTGPLAPPTGGSPLVPPTVLGSFAGLNANDNPLAISPPDTILAVGPNHVIEVVNVALRIFDKDGNVLATQSLDDFFAPLARLALVTRWSRTTTWLVDGTSHDRRVRQQQHAAGRLQHLQPARRLHGNASDRHHTARRLGRLPQDWIQRRRRHSRGQRLWLRWRQSESRRNRQIDTARRELGDLHRLHLDARPQLPGHGTCQMHGSAPGSDVMYFVQERSFGDGKFRTSRPDDRCAERQPDLSTTTTSTSTITVFRRLPQQPGGLINTNDTTFLNADWRNGKLVATHSVGDFNDSDAHAAWYEFDAADAAAAMPTLLQQGRLDPGDGISTYYPSVAITAGGTIGLTYMQSSPSEYASMYVTGRSSGDSSGTMREGAVVAEGEDFLDGFFRAGDYSGITVDPVDGSTFWAANEYKARDAFWSTAIAHFSLGMSVTTTSPANGADRGYQADPIRRRLLRALRPVTASIPRA